jgi:predicted amidophosphoribosyltransferase
MKNTILERSRQDVCTECGRSIVDSEKECPYCGRFPQKAYHERAAGRTLGLSKWVQNSPALQTNQKLSEKKSEGKFTNLLDFNLFTNRG